MSIGRLKLHSSLARLDGFECKSNGLSHRKLGRFTPNHFFRERFQAFWGHFT